MIVGRRRRSGRRCCESCRGSPLTQLRSRRIRWSTSSGVTSHGPSGLKPGSALALAPLAARRPRSGSPAPRGRWRRRSRRCAPMRVLRRVEVGRARLPITTPSSTSQSVFTLPRGIGTSSSGPDDGVRRLEEHDRDLGRRRTRTRPRGRRSSCRCRSPPPAGRSGRRRGASSASASSGSVAGDRARGAPGRRPSAGEERCRRCRAVSVAEVEAPAVVRRDDRDLVRPPVPSGRTSLALLRVGTDRNSRLCA